MTETLSFLLVVLDNLEDDAAEQATMIAAADPTLGASRERPSRRKKESGEQP